MAEGDEASVSRRGFLGLSISSAAAAAGVRAAGGRGAVYLLVDQMGRRPHRLASTSRQEGGTSELPAEQYLFFDTATVTDNGVVVSVPPLHHEVVTAELAVEQTPGGLKAAQSKLEAALRDLERSGLLDYKPAGLGLAVSWGLPYFESPLVGALWKRNAPVDLEASKVLGTQTRVLLPSVRFTTDPGASLLESNEVCVAMASDSVAHITSAYEQLFTGAVGELFKVTSRRIGFVDASQLGKSGKSLTKQFALANKLPAAGFIPDQAELFLGFTSTQRAALGPSLIANFEALGITDQTTKSYFAGGTTLALSHLFEDLASWYANGYEHRVASLFNPRIADPTRTPPGTLTIPEATSPDVETEAEVRSDAAVYKTVGHSSAMQPVSRLGSAVKDPYGNLYPAGTAIPVRADFNTVDNPFAYSSRPATDGMAPGPAAGLHFLVFAPSSFFFQELRAAMDGEYNGQPGIGSAAQKTAFMNVLQTTHRQNFLTPPRAHRSFPLAEMLS